MKNPSGGCDRRHFLRVGVGALMGAGLGPCDLDKIDVVGLPIAKARSNEFPG